MTTNDLENYLYNKVDFSPTEEQKVILDSDKRFILVAGGEQAGKSMIASKFLLKKTFETEEAGLYWLVAADYERTRAEFEYLVSDFAQLGILKKASKRVDPGRIELADGTVIETKSAKDPRTLAMKAPNGIIGCEASQLDLESFYRLRGRCAPRKAWLFLAGTFESSLGWYPQMFQSWKYGVNNEQSYSLPSWTNKHLYPEGKNDPEILRLKESSSDDFFMERIEGIPSPPRGIVFPEFRPDIHVSENIEYVPDEPVHVWIDPGYAGAYAVCAVQIINDQVRVFDEIYEQNLITEEIINIAQNRPWYKDLTYGVIDIAGYQHQAMSAPAEVWLDSTGLYLDSEKININDGTERLKSTLKLTGKGEPKLIISPKCKGLLSEFGAAANPFDGQTKVYQWKVDRDGNVVGNQPQDKYNHGIKALIYGLINHFGYSFVTGRSTIQVRRWS
tara:strand:+ start:4625 stop:5962 length:1338 start_codon:yes stop_codon:yes gene_type:complete